MALFFMNILIVEDHELVREGIKNILLLEKFIELIRCVSSGEEAIENLKHENFDVVIMDIDLVKLNGIETTKIIKGLYPKINILALTIHNSNLIVEKMLSAGANGYILKSSNVQILIDAIKNINKGLKILDNQLNLTKVPPSIYNSQVANTNLTKREIDVLRQITNGFSNKEVANNLFISIKTVETHRTSIMKKLQVNNTAGLVKFAIINGYC